MTTDSAASAPAKLILCGEHAVVYGRPAIAVPLSDLRASAAVAAGRPGTGLRLRAPDLGEEWAADAAEQNPLSELARTTAADLGLAGDIEITLRSQIPIASGMGSGAAIGTALVRALAAHAGRELSAAEIAARVYESERGYHGTPSGVDNTVVAYERSIWYVRGRPPTIEPLKVGAPLTLVVGDTGVRSATRLPVGAVRERHAADPEAYEALFAAVGDLVTRARALLAAGETLALGPLLDENQSLLEQIGVSSPELNRLVGAARGAGALGAKLSGAGWGGVMLALVADGAAERVAAALKAAGAARVLTTQVAAGT